MIDTHCHLTHPRFDADRRAVLERARDAGVTACLTIGTGVEDARACQALAESAPDFVHCAAGIDPFSAHRAGAEFDDQLRQLHQLLAGGRFTAVGEIGLDYHYQLDPKPVQAARFTRQLELAHALDLPVVIHVREAHDDLLAILERWPGARGVIHSFSAGPEAARRYLALGWHLGFTGAVTFRNAAALRAAAGCVPAERLLVETDSPYLAPVPLRGQRAEPAHLAHTLAALAEVRGVAADALAATTAANARALFRWPGPRR